MGMRDLSHIRLTDSVINLTGKHINLYEETSGEIHGFAPMDEEIPAQPVSDLHGKGEIVHYVVNEDTLEELKRTGRSLRDIAIVGGVGAGRHGIEIASLKWAHDLKIPVRLFRGARDASFRHL